MGQVILEAVQMVLVGTNRHRPKTTLGGQVLEEPRYHVGERHPSVGSTPAVETGNNQTQQLLDRTAHLPAHSIVVTTTMSTLLTSGPPRDERIDMNR